MSHASSPIAQPSTVVTLAPGVVASAERASLVAPGGAAIRVASCQLRAAGGAVDVAPVAAAADDHQHATSRAAVESAGLRERGFLGHETNTGQLPRPAG